jgi:tetratricopeptide (TPR) repeat protein
MISAKIQWIAIIATIGAGLIFLYYQQWWQAGLSMAVAGYLIYARMRIGTVYLALRQLYKGNLQKTETYLQKIAQPNKPGRSYRAYDHFCWGYLKMERNDPEGARPHFEQALEYGIRLKNDQAVAHISMANIFVNAGDEGSARFHLEQAENLKHNEVVSRAIERVRSKIG